MTVRTEGIKMDQFKVSTILEWPALKNVQGVRSFLGLANFYQHFIQDYAKVAWSLNDLTKKDEPFVWKEAQQEAFDKLKMLFTTAPVLAFLDNDCQLYLESNASEFATGAVLFMLKEDKWHPVTYNFHSISSEERNYPIADKEVLSIIHTTSMEALPRRSQI